MSKYPPLYSHFQRSIYYKAGKDQPPRRVAVLARITTILKAKVGEHTEGVLRTRSGRPQMNDAAV